MTFAPASATQVKGLSLLEVLVAGAVFSILLTAVVLIELHSHRMRLTQDKKSDAYRAAILLIEFIQAELDGAYVVPGDDGDTQLRYRPPLRNGNRLRIGPSGACEQEQEALIRLLADGKVTRSQASQVRSVARLGKRGRLEFRFPSSNLLDISVHAEPYDDSFYDAHAQILLCNQN